MHNIIHNLSNLPYVSMLRGKCKEYYEGHIKYTHTYAEDGKWVFIFIFARVIY